MDSHRRCHLNRCLVGKQIREVSNNLCKSPVASRDSQKSRKWPMSTELRKQSGGCDSRFIWKEERGRQTEDLISSPPLLCMAVLMLVGCCCVFVFTVYFTQGFLKMNGSHTSHENALGIRPWFVLLIALWETQSGLGVRDSLFWVWSL